MKRMKARTKVILMIITSWVIIFAIIFFAADFLFMSDFVKLEKNLAIENNQRAHQVLLGQLNYIYVLNLDNSYWDDMYHYVINRDEEFKRITFVKDLFIDNKINYVLLLDKKGQIVWANSFNLQTKTFKPISSKLLTYFETRALPMLAAPETYNDSQQRDHGVGGFVELPYSHKIAYFAMNNVFDSSYKRPHTGALIFGKIMTPKYQQQLSDRLDYPLKILPLATFVKTKEGKQINHYLLTGHTIYTQPLNEKVLMTYSYLKNFEGKPIAVLKVNMSRHIYNESKDSTFLNLLIIFILALIGVFSTSVLVYLFFRKQEMITNAFEQFVPKRLLDLLKKKSILDIGLGDSSHRTLSILFLDIRSFTTISEGLTPRENFEFINKLLKEIAPVVTQHNGFIDKFIGDAVMALFPNAETHADDAVKTGLAILDELDKLNASGNFMKDPVRIGIGINTGKSMLGIIGAEGRLEGTVIGDTVNTASRMESLTKNYDGVDILISKACYDSLKQPELFDIQYTDSVKAKGKSIETQVYAVKKKV